MRRGESVVPPEVQDLTRRVPLGGCVGSLVIAPVT